MTRRKRKNIVNYVAVIIVAGLLVGVSCVIWMNFSGKEKIDSSDDKTVIEEVEVKTKAEVEKEQEEIKQDEIVKEKVKQYDGANPNESEKLTGVITYAGVNGGILMVRVNIDQYLANGKCRLELSRDSKVLYGEEVDIVDSAATATCKGFNVATDGLGNGKTNISVIVTTDGKTGTISGEVNL